MFPFLYFFIFPCAFFPALDKICGSIAQVVFHFTISL